MGHRQLHLGQVAVEQIHVVPGDELLVHLLVEELRHVHDGLFQQRMQPAQDATHAHLGTEQAQLRAGLRELKVVHAHDLKALGVDDLAVHKVAGQQHLVGLQVAEADVVGVHRQRDAVVVEGVDVLAPRDHERHLAWTLECQAGDARKHLAGGNGQIGDGSDLLARGIHDGFPRHLRQVEHGFPLLFGQPSRPPAREKPERLLTVRFLFSNLQSQVLLPGTKKPHVLESVVAVSAFMVRREGFEPPTY